MNVFRLFLCLAGLVTFLVIRHFSQPPPPEAPSLPPEPRLSLPTFPQLEPLLSPSRSSNWIESFELEGSIVSLRRSPEGMRFDLVTAQGTNLASNLSERQFEQQHPSLYLLVRGQLEAHGSMR